MQKHPRRRDLPPIRAFDAGGAVRAKELPLRTRSRIRVEPRSGVFFEFAEAFQLCPRPEGDPRYGDDRGTHDHRSDIHVIHATVEVMAFPKVYFSATKGEAQFLADYEPTQATWADKDGMTLLMRALRNGDPASRLAISTRLLDDGADAGAVTAGNVSGLHILLSAMQHDFEAEVPLLERLLDGGADINADSGSRWGTPMQTLSRTFKFSDDQLAPFYDVLFARPELDVTTRSSDGRSVTETAQAAEGNPADLLARCHAHVKQHGSD